MATATTAGLPLTSASPLWQNAVADVSSGLDAGQGATGGAFDPFAALNSILTGAGLPGFLGPTYQAGGTGSVAGDVTKGVVDSLGGGAGSIGDWLLRGATFLLGAILLIVGLMILARRDITNPATLMGEA